MCVCDSRFCVLIIFLSFCKRTKWPFRTHTNIARSLRNPSFHVGHKTDKERSPPFLLFFLKRWMPSISPWIDRFKGAKKAIYGVIYIHIFIHTSISHLYIDKINMMTMRTRCMETFTYNLALSRVLGVSFTLPICVR